MSTIDSLSRYNLIVKKIRKNPSTFKEISSYLELESELQGYHFTVSKRTFQRDLIAIRSIFNIDILYNFSRRNYFIESDEQPEVNERIMEAFDIFNALNITERLSGFIHFERRRPQGTEHLYGILHAIKNRLRISFMYHKYWEDEVTERIADPYGLKEFRNRWYVVANDFNDNVVKSFALDRLSQLEFTKIKFRFPTDFQVNEYFKFCFGIINPHEGQPQEVVLTFNPFQGKYIKSLPLHESQEILIDNDEEFQIKLNLFVTHDFFMEILSYGENVKVLRPGSLIDELKASYQNSISQY
jgi:predicted DNA-binding transcriptional regulator YafY